MRSLDCSILNLLTNFICSQCNLHVLLSCEQPSYLRLRVHSVILFHQFGNPWSEMLNIILVSSIFPCTCGHFLLVWIPLYLFSLPLSPCKNNILIEVLQRVLGTNFWTPGCRRVIIFEKPSSCLKCLTCNLAFICSYNVLGVLQSLHPFLVSSHLFGLCKAWAYTIYFTS